MEVHNLHATARRWCPSYVESISAVHICFFSGKETRKTEGWNSIFSRRNYRSSWCILYKPRHFNWSLGWSVLLTYFSCGRFVLGEFSFLIWAPWWIIFPTLFNISRFFQNYENIKYKTYRGICITVIVLSDISFNLYHFWSREEPLISWEAHLFGGLSGLILGLALYKNTHGLQPERENICLAFSSLVYFLIFTTLVIIMIDSEASDCLHKLKT